MVQDPILYSLCDRITQTGGWTCLLLRSGFSSSMLALVGLGCLFDAGSGSSSSLVSCVICDGVLFSVRTKKNKKQKKKHELYTRIISCGRMFTFNSISWMLHVLCTLYMGDLQDSFCQWSLIRRARWSYVEARALPMPLTNLHFILSTLFIYFKHFFKNHVGLQCIMMS